MIKVRRLGHATISTPDMDGQIDYYGRILGLRVAEKSKDRAILVSKQGFEAIELVKGEKGQLKRLSFQIAPGTDLNDVVKELSKLGIKSEKRSGISPGIAEARHAHRSEGHAGRPLCRVQVPRARRSRPISTSSSSATSPIACSTCSRS